MLFRSERHKISASAAVERVSMKTGILQEAVSGSDTLKEDQDGAGRTDHESPDHELTGNEPIAEEQPKLKQPDTNEHGTPISQLQKRLALIMPLEAKNRGEETHE